MSYSTTMLMMIIVQSWILGNFGLRDWRIYVLCTGVDTHANIMKIGINTNALAGKFSMSHVPLNSTIKSKNMQHDHINSQVEPPAIIDHNLVEFHPVNNMDYLTRFSLKHAWIHTLSTAPLLIHTHCFHECVLEKSPYQMAICHIFPFDPGQLKFALMILRIPTRIISFTTSDHQLLCLHFYSTTPRLWGGYCNQPCVHQIIIFSIIWQWLATAPASYQEKDMWIYIVQLWCKDKVYAA